MNDKPNLGGAIAIVIGPDPDNKTVNVLDKKRNDPQWKFPGGKIEEKDSVVIDLVTGWKVPIVDEKVVAIRAALRELEEETGLKPAKDTEGNVKQVEWAGSTLRSTKKGYTHYVIVVVDDFSTLKKIGNEGELTRTCTFGEIASGEVELLKYHRDFFQWYRERKGLC
jgi:8-oxo-dGTP pyrophosphatase MutT (NUDIX family)